MKLITELYAWAVIRKDGAEFILSMHVEDKMFPMISSNLINLGKMKETAIEIAKNHDLPLNLIRFSGRELIETIEASSHDDQEGDYSMH